MTGGERRPVVTRAATAAALAVAVLGLGACATSGPAPTVTSATPAPSASSGASGTPGASGTSASTGTSTPRTPAPAATGPDGQPTPVSSGPSPVDSTRLRSEADLPRAFACALDRPPITIPAATMVPPAPPPVTGGTVTVPPESTETPTVSPEVVVCGSSFAGGESLYLWYAPTGQTQLVALRAALDLAAHVHAGPNWVAGGMISPTMGEVGGDVYR